MKLKGVNVFEADKLLGNPNNAPSNLPTAGIDGKWVFARPIGYISLLHRIKCAYLVFQGKADIIKWYKQ